jgi:uncharacterized protein
MQQPLAKYLEEARSNPTFEEFTKVDIHTRNCVGETALHFAAIQGNAEIARLLLLAGADPNLKGEHGFTPLHEAIQQNHLDTIRELLSGGADPAIKNDWDQNSFELASLDTSPEYPQKIRQIIEAVTPSRQRGEHVLGGNGG